MKIENLSQTTSFFIAIELGALLIFSFVAGYQLGADLAARH